MCLLHCTTNHYSKMSAVKSVPRNCLPDSLGRHAAVIHKAEFEADMLKSKWHRSRGCNNNHSNNSGNHNNNNLNTSSKRKARCGRSRKKSGPAVEDQRVPSNPSATSTANDENMMSILDFVDCASLDRITCIPCVPDLPHSSSKSKKVHFDEDRLEEVIEFPDDEESEEMRKCYWEVFARDRSRFKDRINQLEDRLSGILHSDHRQKVYNQRFLPLLDT